MPFCVGQDGEFLFEKPEVQKWLLSPKGIETPTCTIRPLAPSCSPGSATFLFSRIALAPVENISPVVRSGYRTTCLGKAKMARPAACLRIGWGVLGGRPSPMVERARGGPPTGRKSGLAWRLRSRSRSPPPCSASPWPGRGRNAAPSERCWPRFHCAMRPQRRRPEPSDGQGFPSPGASCLWLPERS